MNSFQEAITTLVEFLTLCHLLGLSDGIASNVGSQQRSFSLDISIALCQKNKMGMMATKAKINKRDLIQLSSSGTAEETTNKAKRQSMNWDKILANYVTEQGLISRIHKQLT